MRSITGTIFNIDEFAIHDGPGVRQIVFFKGCPLACQWCHNPEGISCKPQIMVSPSGCSQCGACKSVCRHEVCVGCGECVDVCPNGLRRISGERYSVEALAERLLRRKAYYESCGGGVTFSGGEPMLQAEFLERLIPQLQGMHCAIETSGYAEPEVFQTITGKIDYIMMDLKLMDSVRHRRFTGRDNSLILENACYLKQQKRPFVIRIPMIPGVNDDEQNLRETALFLRDARAFVRVEMMPYNRAAGAKYAMIGKNYQPDFDPQQEFAVRQDIFDAFDIESVVL